MIYQDTKEPETIKTCIYNHLNGHNTGFETCASVIRQYDCFGTKETPWWLQKHQIVPNAWLRWVNKKIVNMETMRHPKKQVMLFPSGAAGSPELKDISYPRFASIKYEGTFCLVFDGELYTRRLKLQPNLHLRKRFEPLLQRSVELRTVFMGEIYDPSRQFNEGQSIVRSYAGELFDTGIYVFDCLSLEDWLSGSGGMPFSIRYDTYTQYVKALEHPYIKAVEQKRVINAEAATEFYRQSLRDGYEGTVTRDIKGYYKHGRCTARDNDLFRHREKARCEATVLSVNRGKRLRFDVERTRLLNGLLDRPHKVEDYEDDDIAGSLTVRVLKDEPIVGNIECSIGFGPGFTLEDRRNMWWERKRLTGKTVEVEYNPNENKDKLRQPKLITFRSDK